jgi:hypothetical protein
MSEENGQYMRWDFSLGNIINLVAMGVAVAVAWGAMSERSDVTHKGIKEVEAMQAASETRIRTLEMSQARADERLASILQIVSRIETRLEKEGRK